MEKIILNVEGMSCNHCVNAVKEALGELKVQEVEVSLQDKTVRANAYFTTDPTTNEGYYEQ